MTPVKASVTVSIAALEREYVILVGLISSVNTDIQTTIHYALQCASYYLNKRT